MPSDDSTNYNIVTLKNIDSEDFVFAVDKNQYMIPAGEVRNFPKFMARLAVKHLVDKLLQKEDPTGKTLGNETERNNMTSKILVNEEVYEKPRIPTDEDIVDDMNKPSDMDRILQKNKDLLKKEKQVVPVSVNDVVNKDGSIDYEKASELPEVDDSFDGLKDVEPLNLPSRQEMMDYAKHTLKVDLETQITKGENKGKTIGKVYEGLSDTELYEELQMGA